MQISATDKNVLQKINFNLQTVSISQPMFYFH